MDLIVSSHLIPSLNEVVLGVMMMVLGMLIIGLAGYFHIGAGSGSGPRDGLISP